jgi:hypothetical protein
MTGNPVDAFLSDEPIELGSMLFTMVEPHRGHEVAYNRWYERDHFYSGCMIGPFNFAGGRFVATRDLKALRYPDDSPISPDPMTGSYLALYWVLKGRHKDWNRWSRRQVKVLIDAGRMFPHRDHIHTQLYTFEGATSRDPDGVPPELALDHPFKGLVVVIGQAAEDRTREEALEWYRMQTLPEGAALRLVFAPVPMPPGQPSGVPSSADDERRWMHLYFLDAEPQDVWDTSFAGHGTVLERSGMGRVVFASAFRPTIPGTDTYTDQLW